MMHGQQNTKLKTLMLKIERIWKCGRGDTYFNDIFCVFWGIKNCLKLGVVRRFVCFALPLCVCWV